ncbi:hypothetical protein H5U35_01895 [Candidatus Aerophobetes bacterium]|nr:hypothetical protein [Candidatus Aerophobetes bacterium]
MHVALQDERLPIVIPAKAGIQDQCREKTLWTLAFAGMTEKEAGVRKEKASEQMVKK